MKLILCIFNKKNHKSLKKIEKIKNSSPTSYV